MGKQKRERKVEGGGLGRILKSEEVSGFHACLIFLVIFIYTYIYIDVYWVLRNENSFFVCAFGVCECVVGRQKYKGHTERAGPMKTTS